MNDVKISGNISIIINTLNNLGVALKEEGNYKAAIDTFHTALVLGSGLDLDPIIEGLYNKLAETYFLSNKPSKAYHYLNRGRILDQYLLHEKRLSDVAVLEVKYQTAEKEAKLVLAENENLLKSKQLIQVQFITVILFAAVLIIGLAFGFILQKRKIEAIETHQKIQNLQQKQELNLLQSFFEGQEEERKRIALSLHDSLGGLLYALQLQLSKLGIQKSIQTVKAAIVENRRIMQNLMPSTLLKLDLETAIEEWIEQFETHWSLPITTHIKISSQLPTNIEISLYRIIQELLNNAARHAEATRIDLTLSQKNSTLFLSVKDNGKGIDLEQVSATFLKTVNARLRLINGAYNIKSQVEKGTEISVTVPFFENRETEKPNNDF